MRSLCRVGATVLLGVVLACCTPPPGVPSGASGELNYEGIMHWTWEHRLSHGCAKWMATESYAFVVLYADPNRCGGGPEVDYLSGADELVFRNFWPQGEMLGGNPCPHALSESDIASLRSVAQDALAHAVTEGEKRVLRRVDQRLSNTNGAALMTYHEGWCSDITQEQWRGAAPISREDVWQSGH